MELHWQFIKARVLDRKWNFSLVNLYALAFMNRQCNSITLFFKESASGPCTTKIKGSVATEKFYGSVETPYAQNLSIAISL